ncbi:MAG: T9SS type A sorting domain-containing protein, partial [Bacteroidales bacterium]|nr:T9SS type A sorting domain-containing protein [Bacteroidales bacterium]
IYPNPASDILNIEINNTTKEVLNLNIYNIMGSLVKTETTAANNNQINISDLNNGIYLIEIESKDLITKQKLIIQK